MPRKTTSSGWHRRQYERRFNEAAARCRGKLEGRQRDAPQALAASMRPRPDAAENRFVARRFIIHPLASMRPRPDAAENVIDGAEVRHVDLASMRPRPDAAENVFPGRGHRAGRGRFNEAAARCRGKLRRHHPSHRGVHLLQ